MNTKLQSLHVTSLFLLFTALYIIIICALFSVQIVHYDFYHTLGHNQYHITLTQKPPRAPILDRTGNNYLAMNKERSAAFLLPHMIKDPNTLKLFLQNYFPKAAERLSHNPSKKFLYVKRNLTPNEVSLIEASGCTDIHILKEPSRFYPVPSASCIIGITNKENDGILGIEQICNTDLAGTPTVVSLEKDARSGHFYFTKDETNSGIHSKPIQLTIDADLQFLTYQELKDRIDYFNAQEGSALIMDPSNGHILAMVNIPCFDPHNRTHLDMNSTKMRCLTEQYELGSVFKVFCGLAALAEGVTTPNELIDCKNSKMAYVNGRKVNTVKAHGVLPFCDVVALSNNIGIATVAQRLNDTLYDHYLKLGFGSLTGINIPGERKGFVNGPYNWSKQSVISLSYGYEVSATLLQLACAFSMIAQNGYKVTPTLFLSKQTLPQEKLYDELIIKDIQDILCKTTHYGTAHRAQIKGYTVMSKTGTANMIEGGSYNPHKNRYTCAGIIQKGNYKRVIITFIQHARKKGLYASTVVAPLLEKIAERMLIHERIL